MSQMMAALPQKSVQSEWLSAFQILASRRSSRDGDPGKQDGWGLVSYLNERSPEYIGREPGTLIDNTELFRKAAQWAESSGFGTTLLHVRNASEAPRSIANTHPFLYKEWSFCHNGAIFGSEGIPLKKLRPSGRTDSERFFLYLMESLMWPFSAERRILKAANHVRKHFEHTSLTFLLSNGKKLYAYRACDPRFENDYGLYVAEVDGGKIVCSEPLPSLSRNWTSLANGELIAID